MCSYCNYTQAILFEHITEDDINEVEAFVRNEMLDIILANNGENNDNKIKLMEDYFGELYASRPALFRFQLGDRKFIKLIQRTVTETIEKKGRKRAMQHFAPKKCAAPKKKKFTENQYGQSDTDDAICSAADVDLVNEMKSKLFGLIMAKLKTLAAPTNCIDVSTDSFVTVHTTDSQMLRGDVVCPMCYVKNRQPRKCKPINVYCRTKSGRLSWVISNFNTHIDRAHSLIKNCRKKNQLISNEQHSEFDMNKHSCVTENSSIGNMSGDIMNMVFDVNSMIEVDCIEQQLNDQISKQIAKMWSIATVHCDDLECGVRCNDVDGLHLSVDVTKILGNGDCLLSSAAHQLFGKDVNSPEHKQLTFDLRKNVVKYIQEHYDDFVFDVRGHVQELQEIATSGSGCDTYGFNAYADIDDACKYFVDKCLIRPGFWAGAETVKAIHFLHNVDIIVYNENGPITFYNSNNNEQINRIIALAFRLSADGTSYNHYDSVCNATPEVIYNTAHAISKRMNQKNISKIVLDETQ